MGTIALFFVALLGLVILFTFKILELKSGVKPFSVGRYKVDTFLRKKAEALLQYVRYFNVHTGKLLGLFLIIEGKSFILTLSKKIKETKLSLMVQGKHTPENNGNDTASNYLKRFAALKDKKNDLPK